MASSTLSFDQWIDSQWTWVFQRHPYLQHTLSRHNLVEVQDIFYWDDNAYAVNQNKPGPLLTYNAINFPSRVLLCRARSHWKRR